MFTAPAFVEDYAVICGPDRQATQRYKGLVGPGGRGIFDGKIVVRPHAVKTSAEQRNKNLLLGENASVDSKPQLEIENNDVKCTHGSTTGRLDPGALFYLRSRGFSEKDATSLLTFAFGSELIDRVKVPGLRESLSQSLHGWMSA